MLGRLAKWLRIMGYDTVYQRVYAAGALDRFVREGRCLLTRHRKRAGDLDQSVLLHKNRVGEQLAELSRQVDVTAAPSRMFSRCIRCNVLLMDAPDAEAREQVPEYIYYQNPGKIRFCPMCHRYYWPGSHRTRMQSQLRQWGMLTENDAFRGLS